MTDSPPPASSIPISAIKYILTLYNTTLEAFYKTKLKDTNKVSKALDLDTWRYDNLPAEIAARATSKRCLTQSELEKLVEWKMGRTHGKFRPFLLPQIRKNTTSQVSEVTLQTRRLLDEADNIPSDQTLRTALDAACALKGVGPATATLVLSVFAPAVPFFQDELYAWLVESGTKLKYNVKEYFELVNGVRTLRDRLGGAVATWEVEKLGFVIGHWDLVGTEEREKVWSFIEEGVDLGLVSVEDAGKKRKGGGELVVVDDEVGRAGKKAKTNITKTGARRSTVQE